MQQSRATIDNKKYPQQQEYSYESSEPSSHNFDEDQYYDDESRRLLDQDAQIKIKVLNTEFEANLNALKLEREHGNSRDQDTQTDLSIEDYLDLVGGFGPFQIFAFLTLFLIIQSNGFLLYNQPFLELEPQLLCYNNATDSWNSCTREVACKTVNGKFVETYKIDHDSDDTLENYITEMGLECSSQTRILGIGSFYFVGVLFSIIIWIKCSDFWGRKPIVALGSSLQLAAYTGVIFFQNSVSLMYLFYFTLGMGTIMTMCTSYNYLIEFVPTKRKIDVGTVYLAAQILPAVALPLYLMFLSDNLQFYLKIGYLAVVVGIIFLNFLPESPKYSFSIGKFQECEDSLNYIARFNRSSQRVDLNQFISEKINGSYRLEPTMKRESQFKWFLNQMIQNNHNVHLIIFMMCWTVCSFNYYMLIFHLPRLEGSLYLNGLAITVSEFFGNLIIGVIIYQFGLKTTIIASFSLMCATSILYIMPFLDIALWYAGILFLMKFGLTCAFASSFYGTNVLFREEMTAIIFAICNMFSRFFTIFAPLASAAKGTTVMLIFLSLSALAIIVSGLIIEPQSKEKKKRSKKRKQPALEKSQ